MLNTRKDRKKGFTLIELIAVMVILGILAAVAIPKYTDLTAEAERGAAMGAVGAGMSQMSMLYSQWKIEEATGTRTTATTAAAMITYATANYTDLSSDYTLGYAADGTGIAITATSNNDGTITVSKTWAWPQ